LKVVTHPELEQWLDDLDISPASQNTYLNGIRTFFRWAKLQGRIPHDPGKYLENRRTPRRLPRPIAATDLAAAMFVASKRMRLMLSLGAYGGLRAGEIGSLRGKDVDLIHKKIRIAGKGGTERVIPLAAQVEQAMVAHGFRQGRLIRPESLNSRQDRFISDAVRGHFIALNMQWGAHSLRHYFATEVFRQTKDLLLVSHLLGHASVATTQQYTYLTPSVKATEVVRNLCVEGSRSLSVGVQVDAPDEDSGALRGGDEMSEYERGLPDGLKLARTGLGLVDLVDAQPVGE
jgi:integrase/recombinase XerC